MRVIIHTSSCGYYTYIIKVYYTSRRLKIVILLIKFILPIKVILILLKFILLLKVIISLFIWLLYFY